MSKKRFNECRNVRELPFDFYLPKLNICIEYDGLQHFSPIDKWGGDDRFSNIKTSDNIKNNFCIQNNIKIIRIPYTEYDNIDNILKDEILNLKNNLKIDTLKQRLDIANDYKYTYNFNNYVNVNSEIDIICPLHGLNIKTAYKSLQGNSCPNCSESKGQKEIAKFLDKYKIHYERQKKFHDCRNIFELPFDFYIPV
jgi:very-short-patch-repair endonuclease